MKKKVMVAMSGGVDSSVAAALLIDQGYTVCGATLKLYDNEDIGINDKTRTCCSLQDVEDARSVAYKLGVEHFVFNFGAVFKEQVINKFIEGYCKGETPNPCIDCNRYIKFDRLLDRAILLDNDYISTGHYAQVEHDTASGRFLLKRARDLSKDQTYVLYSMTQRELSHTLFPLGRMLKSEVRKIAGKRGLINAGKPDSQDICFVKDGDYAGFIENNMGITSQKGNFIDNEGNILGEHKGIIHYTIGQRKGLGISIGHPAFVIAKDIQKNTVTLGSENDLLSDGLIAGDINLIAVEKLSSSMSVSVKTRYKQLEASAKIFPVSEDRIFVEFKEKQKAVTPGQAVVFYDGDVVIGGGTILLKER